MFGDWSFRSSLGGDNDVNPMSSHNTGTGTSEAGSVSQYEVLSDMSDTAVSERVQNDFTGSDFGGDDEYSREFERPDSDNLSQASSVYPTLDTDYDSGDLDDYIPEGGHDFGFLDELDHVYCSSSDEENSNGSDLREELGVWASQFQITNAALSSLLGILQCQHPELPKDARTLLSTPTDFLGHTIAGGEYYHFGIESSIVAKLQNYRGEIENIDVISLQINIDGLPIFKSSSGQFWPILGMIDNISRKDPFSIGLYYGKSKPSSNIEYLSYFINELKELLQTGINCFGINFGLILSAMICDAPARSFVKGTKGHSGYSACERCTTAGTWLGKMTFPVLDAPLRTDTSFSCMEDDAHHTGPSPFADIPFGMVSQVPLDYMHLVCLGVMRRLLLLWLKGPLKQRIGGAVVREISGELESLRGDMPCEFARKPRSLAEMDRWKATEFRQFLLYTGPLVLFRKLDDHVYHNFLLLSVALHILLSPRFCADQELIDYSEKLLLMFVENFGDIYGKDMVGYNVHCLVHLPQDARKFGNLDNISCFPFENYLGKMKKLVRKPSQPLQQVVRRISEKAISVAVVDVGPRCRRQHISGPIPQALAGGNQFKALHFSLGVISTAQGNNCVQINNEVVIVKNIVVVDGKEYIVYCRFGHSTNFFKYPLESQVLGISLVSKLRPSLHFSLVSDIQMKMVLLPCLSQGRDSFLALPMLHFNIPV